MHACPASLLTPLLIQSFRRGRIEDDACDDAALGVGILAQQTRTLALRLGVRGSGMRISFGEAALDSTASQRKHCLN